MVKLKVRRIGNSLGVVLPKDVLARLNSEDGAALYLIEEPDGGYRLSPYDPEFEAQMEAIEDVIRRYPNTLRALAK